MSGGPGPGLPSPRRMTREAFVAWAHDPSLLEWSIRIFGKPRVRVPAARAIEPKYER